MKNALQLMAQELSKAPCINEGNVSESAELVLRSLTEGLDIDRASIWMFSEDRRMLTCDYQLDNASFRAGELFRIDGDEASDYLQSHGENFALIAVDVREHRATQCILEQYLNPEGITALVDYPVYHGTNLVGLLRAEATNGPHQWSVDELFFCGLVAYIFGRALIIRENNAFKEALEADKARLEENAIKRAAELEGVESALQSVKERLVENEKAAALGEMVATVTHEVNNPLGIAITSLSHGIEELRGLKGAFDAQTLSKNQFSDYLQEIDAAMTLTDSNLHRASELIQNFHRSAVDQTNLEQSTINLTEYLEKIISPFKALFRKRQVQFEFIGEQGVDIHTYPGAISQIMTNLIVNSLRHAFPEGWEGDKRIEIEVKSQSDKAQLIYQDNGKGMSAEIKDKMLEPFFTTARERGGTGLGMSIVLNLLREKLNGSMEVESQENQGMRVIIDIPTNMA